MDRPGTPPPRGSTLVLDDTDDAAIADVRTKRTKRPGYVYFMGPAGFSGRIKIGWALTPRARLSQLQTGNQDRLILYGSFEGTREDESKMHREFAHLRRQGEWFDLDHDLMLLTIGLGAPLNISHDDGSDCGPECNRQIIERFRWALLRRYKPEDAAARVIRRL